MVDVPPSNPIAALCVCVCVCVSMGLTKHADRGVCPVSGSSEIRDQNRVRGQTQKQVCECVCVCVCVCAGLGPSLLLSLPRAVLHARSLHPDTPHSVHVTEGLV